MYEAATRGHGAYEVATKGQKQVQSNYKGCEAATSFVR